MNARLVDWIWNVRGSLPLPHGQSTDDVFDRLDPLFHQAGTSHQRAGDTLTFTKKDQAAQDKMAVFDSGVLQVERGATGPVLRYSLTSRMLLFCFFLPLLFLGFAGLTVVVNEYQKPTPEAAAKAKKEAEETERKKFAIPMSALDKALGAPAPDKPKKPDPKKKDDGEKTKPTAAYVFAALFATLYVVGRILEARLFRSLVRKRLFGA